MPLLKLFGYCTDCTNTSISLWDMKFWGYSKLFKTEQAATEVSLLQLEASGVVPPIRRVFRQKEKRLKTAQKKFSNE